MKTGLHHVAISPADYEGTKRYYQENFGLELVFELDFVDGGYLATDQRPADSVPVVEMITGLKGTSGRQSMFRVGNAHLEFFDFEQPQPKPRDSDWTVFDHGISHVCFQVEGIESWYEQLGAKGVEFHCPPLDFGEVKVTYSRDPEGRVVELIEPLEPGQHLSVGDSRITGCGGLKLAGVHHTGISTINWETMRDFYHDGLGLEILFEMDFSDGRFDTIFQTDGSAGMNVMFRAGENSFFEIFEFESPESKPKDPNWQLCDHGLPHFCLEVDDLQALYDRLSAKGVRFTGPPLSFGDVIAAYAFDPEGNVIELLQTLESGKELSVLN